MTGRAFPPDPVPRTLGLIERLGLLAFMTLVAWTILIGGGQRGIYEADLRIASLGLITAGLATWAVIAWRRPRWRPRSVIWPAVVIPPAVLTLSTLLSRTPRLGLEYVGWAILLAALYLLLVRVLTCPAYRSRMSAVAAVLALVVGTAYVIEVGMAWLEFWGLVGRVTPPPLRPNQASLVFGNPSAVMTVQVLLWIAAVAGLGFSTPMRRVVLGVTGMLTIFAVVVSGSRAGWLGLAASIGLVGFLWLRTPDHRGRIAALIGDRRARVGLIGWAMVATLTAFAIMPGYALRAGAAGENLRVQYATIALRQFTDAPLSGRGPGTWAAERIERTLPDEPEYYIPHAHDVYVQTAGELGLLGLAGGAILVGTVGWLVVGGIRRGDPERRRWGWCALLGLTYFAAHQLLDFYANMPAALLAAAIPVALLDATAPNRLPGALGAPPRWVARAATLMLVVACGLAILGLGRAEQIAALEEKAVATANAGDPGAALDDAQKVAGDDPEMPPYQLTLGLAAMEAGRPTEAAAAFRRMAESDDLPQAWLDLAVAELADGRPDGAREAVDRALRLGVQQPVVAYASAWILEQLGDTDAADDALVEAISRLPSLADDPLPVGQVEDRWVDILALAKAHAPHAAWEIALVGENESAAMALAPTTGMADLAEAVTRAWYGDAAALAEVERLAAENPLQQTYSGWAARINARVGDVESAERYRRWGDIVSGSAMFGGRDVSRSSVERARDQGGQAGSLATFHGLYVYRRPVPWDMLTGDAPRLVFE